MGMTISKRVRNKFTKSKYQVTLGMFKTGSRLNRLPGACPGSMVVGSVKKGKTKLRKTIACAIIIRQKKIWRRSNGIHIFFEDNACVVVNQKGELKCKKI